MVKGGAGQAVLVDSEVALVKAAAPMEAAALVEAATLRWWRRRW